MLLQRFERNISVLGRSKRTFECYSRHVAALALHFQCLPTELEAEQVQDYLYELQQRSKTPSQTYFKHTVYGLRFLLKTEGLAYDYLKLPEIKREKKLPVILSREEIWRMLQSATLLKHKLLIGLLYGCGMRCMEVRNLELRHLDFDRKLVHIVQSKGNKDRYVPLSDHLIRGLITYISAERPKTYLFEGKGNGEGKDFDSRYSQRGVQWVVKSVSKAAGILKEVHTHMLRHSYATHLLEDGVNIITVQKLLGHANIESTMVYLHVCQTPDELPVSPLDKVFRVCSRSSK
ncbi:tyrosine-type recombinase/integrase [Parapedobacter sp. ISTM3]|uniref:tyrosine-type recombinase/integrase n=1 Tax=Parapedobacter sp. ISTM3 TaxID=2800130 RepID=UPI00190718F4|nr:tyrosine-type recombinase/integrase [Parapedobacter sp. ISTM3]MBK1439663.1 tyrosine-type recombinase/integrase [Parapedobacter sp. ISTM3]